MAELLNQSHILVLPYREASQSSILTLGISARIPMIITRVGGLMEQIGTDQCIFAEPNSRSIANGIIQLIENRQLYNSIQTKLSKIPSTIAWTKSANHLNHFIDSMKIN